MIHPRSLISDIANVANITSNGMVGICRLCGLDKKFADSHIIPDFMYQYLFDEKHKLILSTSDDFKKEDKKIKKRNTGDYDNSILCLKCDNEVIGQYETYASKVIYGKSILPAIAPVIKNYYNAIGTEWSSVSNIDYRKFKLFLLSILWRASITKRDMFKDVNIGKHEDVLKKMIWDSDPGNEGDYPIILFTANHDKGVPRDFIMQPRTEKLYGHHIVTFPITGMMYVFFVSSHKKPDKILERTIKKNNTMMIERIPVGQGMEYFIKNLGIK
jgi:hypothetical protein